MMVYIYIHRAFDTAFFFSFSFLIYMNTRTFLEDDAGPRHFTTRSKTKFIPPFLCVSVLNLCTTILAHFHSSIGIAIASNARSLAILFDSIRAIRLFLFEMTTMHVKSLKNKKKQKTQKINEIICKSYAQNSAANMSIIPFSFISTNKKRGTSCFCMHTNDAGILCSTTCLFSMICFFLRYFSHRHSTSWFFFSSYV